MSLNFSVEGTLASSAFCPWTVAGTCPVDIRWTEREQGPGRPPFSVRFPDTPALKSQSRHPGQTSPSEEGLLLRSFVLDYFWLRDSSSGKKSRNLRSRNLGWALNLRNISESGIWRQVLCSFRTWRKSQSRKLAWDPRPRKDPNGFDRKEAPPSLMVSLMTECLDLRQVGCLSRLC